MQQKLNNYIWVPAHFQGIRGRFKKPPRGIMIHSGEASPRVAEWTANPWNADGYRRGHYHFAWSDIYREFVQTELLTNTAEHAGKGWNDICWSVALPGPWNQPKRNLSGLRELISRLLEINPGIAFLTCHEWVSPGKKIDPGPGFDLTAFSDFGFRRGKMVKLKWFSSYSFLIYRTCTK